MTALDLIATVEADKAYLSAQRFHERQAMIDARSNRPLNATKHAAAARRLAHYASTELLVIRAIPEPRDGQWR